MTSRRWLILAQFKLALETIDGTGSYNFDVAGGGGVSYWKKGGVTQVTLPRVALAWDDDRRAAAGTDTKSRIYRELEVICDGHVEENPAITSAQQYDRMAEDIERAVMLAADVEGADILSIAHEVDWQSSTPFPTLEGQSESGVTVRFAVRYKNLEYDPSTE